MRRTILSVCLLFLIILNGVVAFSQTDSIQKYRRSTLTMILLQGTNYEDAARQIDQNEIKIDCSPQAITKLWNEYPFPDMYDQFDIPNVNVEVVSNLSAKDIFEARKGKQQRKDAEATRPKIEKELKDKKVAQQIVKRWFSSEDGTKFWDMGTIQKRGRYNATEADVATAQHQVRGLAKLGDAGEELLNNSFVTVTDLLIYANKPIAELYYALANELNTQASQLTGTDIATAIVSATYAATAAGLTIAAAAIQDGYSVVSKTYLYKLKWNDEIANELYANWENDAAFEKMNFELEFVGYQLNETIINRGIFNKKANRQPELVIKQSVVRNIDETFALLQQENDVFKPSVPILGIDPVSAQIGMKEGLEGNEKFDVLQKIQDPITGKFSYHKVGQVKVDKQYVWDNRYVAGEKPEHINYDADGKPIKLTYFKGGKDLVPGMLLKQSKSKKKKKSKK